MDMDDTNVICMDDLRETVDAELTCLNHKCREQSVIKGIASRPSKALDQYCPKCGSNFFVIVINKEVVIVYGEVKNGKKKSR